MTIELKFIIFQSLIIIPFCIGTFLKKWIANSEIFAKRIINFNLICIEPFIILWSIWGLNLIRDLVFLPVLGVVIVLVSFLFGKIGIQFIKSMQFDNHSEEQSFVVKKRRTTYMISTSLSNHGFTMGGFLCFFLGGEKGLALAAIFVSYFMPFVFLFIFPYAQFVTSDNTRIFQDFKSFIFKLNNMPLVAVFIALILHLIDIQRPDVYFPINVLLMITISIYYMTLGINFSLSDIKQIGIEHYMLALIKFICVPLTIALLVYFLPIDYSIKSVVLVQSFMPAAVYSVITSILYNLDSKLASGLFVINTILFIVLVLPGLFYLKGSLFF